MFRIRKTIIVYLIQIFCELVAIFEIVNVKYKNFQIIYRVRD